MDRECCAEMAVKREKGFSGNPLRAKLILDTAMRQMASSLPNEESLADHIKPLQHESKSYDYESLELRKIRQAEERKRLEREIIEEEQLNQQL